jgi:hypothetical protein
MSIEYLDDLRAKAQYARDRYRLYKAKAYGPRGTRVRHVCASSNGSTSRQKHVFAPQRLRSGVLPLRARARLVVPADLRATPSALTHATATRSR